MDVKSPPRESPVWKTALYEQYWRLKDSAPGCVLFFRLGDFYELFGEDAVTSAPLLEVQLTSRDKNSDCPVPMCGVPAHAIDSYAEKLLARGKHIALAEQLSEPGKAKIVERGIIRILTPGLPVDFGRMDSRSQHWFLSVGGKMSIGSRAGVPAESSIQVQAFDFLGGELFQGEVAHLEELSDLLARLNPREILLPASWIASPGFSEKHPVFAESGNWYSRVTPWSGDNARENLEAYLVYTQRCAPDAVKNLLPDARDLATLSGAGGSDWARIPANVYEHWAVFPELFELFDGCGSAVGSRRLRSLIGAPLKNVQRIQRRQQAFALIKEPDLILSHAKDVYDFERILGRFRVGAAAPRELLRFLASFKAANAALQVAPLAQPEWQAFVRDEKLSNYADTRAQLEPIFRELQAALAVDVDATRMTQLSELILAGFDAEFDRLKNLQGDAESWLASFEEKLRGETGISSLKVRYNRVFGYYIEVTKTHLDKVPAHFERKQTTVGGERFTCLELREKENEILTAGVRCEQKAREILESLQGKILAQDKIFRDFIAHFSWVDAIAGLQSRVRKAKRFGPWSVPQVEAGDFYFTIQEARHPILENLTGNFISNSLELGRRDGKRLLVLTGPNMAGKSTLMRQTGICLLLAQCGLPVPAAAMNFAPCSGFYSRMGATDRILMGESTFMVEMKETASILRSADAQSFILLDEIGRGTSTQDGLAIARAVLDHLHNDLNAVCIFATHYHELSEAAEELPHAVNGSMGIREWEGELVFLRTLEFKPAESSHGIFVARMAGLPKKLLSRAQDLFLNHAESPAMNGKVSKKKPAAQSQLTFDLLVPAPAPAEIDPRLKSYAQLGESLSEHIRLLKLDEMSPKQAWLALEGIAERVNQG